MIVTRGLSEEGNLLVTRGFGETLYIIVTKGISFYGMGSGKYPGKKGKKDSSEEDLLNLIQTKTIQLLAEDTSLKVRVLFAKAEEVNDIKLLVEALDFTNIKVVLEDEVRIIE